MTPALKALALLFFVLLIGCKGNSSCTQDDLEGEGAQCSGSEQSTSFRMGSGDPFVQQAAQATPETVSDGMTAEIRVEIRDSRGRLHLDPVMVEFSSACANLETPLATITSPILVQNGVALSTYQSQGCQGADNITATAVINDETLSATARVIISEPEPWLLGAGTPFQSGVASTNPTTIAQNGTTTVSAEIRDTQGNLYTQPVSVTFTSACAGLEAPLATLSSPVLVQNGIASSEYQAQGCVGIDNISVQASINGTDLLATTQVFINADQPWQLGSGSPFQPGVAMISPRVIEFTDTAQIRVEIRNSDGELHTEPVSVDFSSACADLETPQAAISTPVLVQDGIALSTYRSQGCTGPDTIRVTARIDGEEIVATGQVTVTPPAEWQIGSGSPFQKGSVTVSPSTLESAGVAQVRVEIRDTNGALYTQPVLVDFTSGCSQLSTPLATLTSPVLVQDGIGLSTYQANGCTGVDNVFVTATIDGATLSATGQVNVTPPTEWFMGSGRPFQSGVASVALGTLSASGTTQVSVRIQDRFGVALNKPASVIFTSTCANQTPPLAVLSSPVLSQSGVANSTYQATGCTGVDTLQVTATVDNQTLTATNRVTILPAQAGSIRFLSATPDFITLPGGNGDSRSWLSFEVLDSTGRPLSGQLVDFALSTSIGGIKLEPAFATTDNSGLVQTSVLAGTAATSVRVTATVRNTNPALSTQSSLLTMSTGIPDQDSFSLSLETRNPEAWSFDGVEVQLTARLADLFNHPAPDGTAVSFFTEGGSITSRCLTQDGACSVIWTSQNPRPTNGRVTILATAIGEESFPDINANGRFDGDEISAFQGINVANEPYDLAEAFIDFNENSLHDGNETFLDFNSNGIRDFADGVYNGTRCAIPTHFSCSTSLTSTQIRRSSVLVMSGSHAVITANPTTLNIAAGGIGTTQICVEDARGQPMPEGTTVSFTIDDLSLANEINYTWENTNQAGSRCVNAVISAADVDPPIATTLSVTVTTPAGIITQSNSVTVSVP